MQYYFVHSRSFSEEDIITRFAIVAERDRFAFLIFIFD